MNGTRARNSKSAEEAILEDCKNKKRGEMRAKPRKRKRERRTLK